MSNAQIISELNDRSSLANLGPAIDESLTRRIDSINQQIRAIERQPGNVDLARGLHIEAATLRAQLADIRRFAGN